MFLGTNGEVRERDGGKLRLYVERKPKASFGDQPTGLVEGG
jgi:hypothetical protein